MIYQQALQAYRAGDVNGAARMLGNCIQQGQATANELRLASRIAYQQTQYAAAHSIMRMLASKDKLTVNDLIAKAHIELELADLANAKKTVALIDPDTCTIDQLSHVSGVYEQTGDLKKAASLLEPHILCNASPNTEVVEQLLGQWLAMGQGAMGLELITSLTAPTAKSIWLATHFHDDKSVTQFIKRHFDKAESKEDKIWLGFALGRAYERDKQYDDAWHCLQFANRLKATTFNEDDLARPYKTLEHYQALGSTLHSEPATSSPMRMIFVVGAPRSGTTLLARMLGQLDGAKYIGEQPFIGRIAPVLLAGKISAQRARDYYLDHIRQRHEQHTKIVIDDHPYNFLYIEAIKLMFSNAIIVGLDRNRFDLMMANYKTCFDDKAEPLSYDLNKLSDYLELIDNRLNHNDVIRVKYEQLVTSPRQALAKALRYLGTSYDAKIEHFYNDKSAILTASTAQARKPLNSDSIGYKDRYPMAFTDFLKRSSD